MDLWDEECDMSQVSGKDVAAIRDWMEKEPTLPKNFDDIMLKKFLFSCHNSLERTKRCIKNFCTNRATMTEIFTNRDPNSIRLKTAFNVSNLATFTDPENVNELLIYRLNDPEKYDFYDATKTFMLHADHWIRLEKDVLPENHIVIFDIKHVTLMLVAKTNIIFFQKFLIFLLEAMPVRLHQAHVINCPSYYEYLYGLVKGALPQEVRDIIHFHTDHAGLHKYIDKNYLPLEYDGEAESMVQQSLQWIQEIYDDRKFYLNENLWKADISKKVKNGPVDTVMSGSFRTLAID